jgi:hypothetical protein
MDNVLPWVMIIGTFGVISYVVIMIFLSKEQKNWSEQTVYPDLYSYPEEFDKIKKENENLHLLLKDICGEWNEDCDEACDSWGHTETCKMVSIAEAKKAMREEIERLTIRIELLEHDMKSGDYETLYTQTVAELEEANTSIFNLRIANRNKVSVV